MEPPAVTTCNSQNSNGMEKVRRQAADYLQIDPSSTFINNATRNFEDLPENFLDTISPQQSTQSLGQLMNDHANSPQLAPLAPMSIGSDQSGPYMMSIGSQYQDQIRHPTLDKSRLDSFGTGPAGLLSPLHLDSHNRRHASNSEFARHVYIKEETDPLDAASHHLLMQQQIPLTSQQQQQQQELDRLAQAETPPAVSNVELASTMIASLIGEQRTSSPSPQNYSVGVSQASASMMQQRLANIKRDTEDSLEGRSNGDDVELELQRQQFAQKAGRRVYSTKDSNDPLNAEIDDDIYIDTKELCKRIAYELKQHSIPQAIFAERILCRSQGTLSDLLRNPKPWNKLKSGRETFRRMFNWVQQPLAMRLGILDMYKQEGDDSSLVVGGKPPAGCGMSPPTPAQNVRHSSRRSLGDSDQPSNKRPRLVFTDIQKRTLQAIFKETQRPSREMQQTIAEHLRLDLSTVANFFMNARRRSRIGPNSDEPQPYQQVRPISPPPDSPPNTNTSGSIGNGPPMSQSRNRRQPASMQHVEATVSSVAESAIQYSREQAAHDAAAIRSNSIDDDDSYKMYKMNDPLADETGISIIPGNVHDVYNNGDAAVESLTSIRTSPVNIVERNVVKKENDGLTEEAAAQ
ncbi:CUT domain protein [Dictyocaulus viviparus]|uniref:One cut domain family member n=1 Tax=Dictyocaulus viviparus TaxID=29172 RepID=A0A0D8XQG1_DICVI|nr:CUT domain protein [Dictyocaulus viviparus]